MIEFKNGLDKIKILRYTVICRVIRMYNIMEGYSKEFRKVINHIISLVVTDFIEVGSNLQPEVIYYSVFPPFEKMTKDKAMDYFDKLVEYSADGFEHKLTPYDEYVLYKILKFQYDSTDDGYLIKVDNIDKELFSKLPDNEKEVILNAQLDADYLIGLIFDDLDFLDVSEYYELYKRNPEILEKFFHVNLDNYIELMPPDIRNEYLSKRKYYYRQKKAIDDKASFEQIVETIVCDFQSVITHKNGYTLLYENGLPVSEKIVQNLFRIYAFPYEEIYNLDISPEANTGRGLLDFKISRGSKYKAIIEIKLDSNENIREGIKFQLPMYLKAEKASLGYFILICFNTKSFILYDEIKDLAKKCSADYKCNISALLINATNKKVSASKIKKKEEMQIE